MKPIPVKAKTVVGKTTVATSQYYLHENGPSSSWPVALVLVAALILAGLLGATLFEKAANPAPIVVTAPTPAPPAPPPPTPKTPQPPQDIHEWNRIP